jgi:alkaline phosphatase D
MAGRWTRCNLVPSIPPLRIRRGCGVTILRRCRFIPLSPGNSIPMQNRLLSGRASIAGRSAAAILVLLPLASLPAADPPSLTHGPIVGRPIERSMRIWGRTSAPARFEVRYGTDPARLDLRSSPVETRIEHDNTGWTELTDLRPDTRYHYRIYLGDAPQGFPGSFRTLPASDDVRHAVHNPHGLFNFQFEIGSCANQNPLHGIGHSLPTYSTMLRELRDRVQFAVMNGDWLYEEMREYPADAWRLAQGLTQEATPRIVQIAPTIVGLWENYRLYLSRGASLSAWHRQVPSFFTFDDHELVNDIWGAGTAGHRHRRTVFRDIGVQAWHDYLGWANPLAHNTPARFGRARFQRGSPLLVDQEADFTRLPLTEMANLHVHWGKPTDGVNEIQYDDDSGHPNSKVYDIIQVVDRHTLRISPAAAADGECSYSIGRRNYGRFRVANCEFYLLDTRSHRDLHDIRQRDKPGLSLLGQAQRQCDIVGSVHDPAHRRGRIRV